MSDSVTCDATTIRTIQALRKHIEQLTYNETRLAENKLLFDQLAERDAEIEYLNKKVSNLKACIESWVNEFNIKHQQLQQAHCEIEELHSRINNYIYEYSLEVMKDCPECANILRATTEEVTNAHRRGWEQCKMEALNISKVGCATSEEQAELRYGKYWRANAIASMTYKEEQNDTN